MITYLDYLKLLKNWLKSYKNFLFSPKGKPELLFYGTGYSDNWSVQTNLKAFGAIAVLSSLLNSKQLQGQAIKLLRFSLETHIEGTFTCTDGKKWGHSWISVLGLERAMHGLEAIKGLLTENDLLLLKKVMISESDWLVDQYYRRSPEEKREIKAGLIENNDPESNIWNGSFLLRVSLMYPEEKRRVEYINKAIQFIVNGLSIPSDKFSDEIIEGKKVSEWFVGPNFFDTFALNHHGYLNIGYMVICLSNLAILHFTYRLKNINPPKFIYRHVEQLWNVLKNFILPDGRLLRIGGDTRIRYCYCQDYIIPALLFIYDFLGDRDCIEFEKGWLKIVKKEMDYNKDGSFLSKRLKGLLSVSPLYYTRLETDRAITLSMGAYWRKMLILGKKQKKIRVKNFWYDNYHGAIFIRSRKRINSFCWIAAQPPQGLCLPQNKSDIVEWRNNLSGIIIGTGRNNYHKILNHKEYIFKGGFATLGKTQIISENFIEEGRNSEILSENTILFICLPDDTTTLVLQRFLSKNFIFIKEIKGLLFNLPNDIFNNCVRYIYSEEKTIKLLKQRKSGQKVLKIKSNWVNIDNCIGIVGVYGSDSFYIKQSCIGQTGLKLSQYESQVINTGLYVEEICYPYKSGLIPIKENEKIIDIACLVYTEITAEKTCKKAKEDIISVKSHSKDAKTILIKGEDNFLYLIAVNFGSIEILLSIKLKNPVSKIESLIKKRSKIKIKSHTLNISLEGGTFDLFKLKI
ncbi:MAG: hypothetical protein NC827_07505 [Candidatus Omnitrophica bacterium]|nr:hypothetical protein [Candidatus Omnitrophota bacterium]MCM8803136.1 hypothetical protein [Candidatus Omnitrophota bacterium]